MTPEQAGQQLFAEHLDCTVELGCRIEPWRVLGRDGAEMRLRAVSLVEDARADENEERQDRTLQRLEAKLDLVLALCGQLLRERSSALAVRPVRLSARGAAFALAAGDAPVQAGAAVVFTFQAAEWLADPVSLPARVLAVEADGASTRVHLAFQEPGHPLDELLERHVFRLHRRGIAQQRQAQR